MGRKRRKGDANDSKRGRGGGGEEKASRICNLIWEVRGGKSGRAVGARGKKLSSGKKKTNIFWRLFWGGRGTGWVKKRGGLARGGLKNLSFFLGEVANSSQGGGPRERKRAEEKSDALQRAAWESSVVWESPIIRKDREDWEWGFKGAVTRPFGGLWGEKSLG